jgi:hypothetical protein
MITIFDHYVGNVMSRIKCKVDTVIHVRKSHPREGKNVVFIDKWTLYGGYFIEFIPF